MNSSQSNASGKTAGHESGPLDLSAESNAQPESLAFIAEQLVEGLMAGRHRSPFRGTSVEFVEHREYSRGDEFRHIDWRAFGKTGRYYVKEFEDETSLRAELILDTSRSMAYAGSTQSKFAYATRLCASLALLLLNQRDSVGLWLISDVVRQALRTTSNQSLYPELIQILEKVTPAGTSGYTHGIRKVLPGLHRRSIVVLISDFFDEPAQMIRMLEEIRNQKHDVLALRISSPEEREFPFRQPTLFRGLEDPSNQILADPVRLRASYLARYRDFERRLVTECGRLGIDHHVFRTDQPLLAGIRDWLNHRRSRRRGQS